MPDSGKKCGASGGTAATSGLLLFVAGNEAYSCQARASLKKFCKREFGEPCAFEEVDVLEHPEIAERYGVQAVPMLLRLVPQPEVAIAGALTDAEELRRLLRDRRPA